MLSTYFYFINFNKHTEMEEGMMNKRGYLIRTNNRVFLEV